MLTGGKRKEGPGDYYEPTVIADVDHSMKVMREETFGPVIPVMRVADAEEALRWPTTAFTGSARPSSRGTGRRRGDRAPDRGRRLRRQRRARQLRVLGLPMGGWKSGIGVRHGAQGIRRYCRTESMTVPRLPTAKSELIWYPYSLGKRKLISRLYRLLNARGLRNRLGL